MSLHGWPSAAAVCGPISVLNSSESSVKRLSSSICQTKRSGWRRSPGVCEAGCRGSAGRGGACRLAFGRRGGDGAAMRRCRLGWLQLAARLRRGRRFDGVQRLRPATQRSPAAPSMLRCRSVRCEILPASLSPCGAAGGQRRGGERERRRARRGLSARPSLAWRRRRRVQQRAVGRKQRERLVAAGEQPLRLLRQRQTRPGLFGRDHQDGRRAIGQRRSASRCTSARRPCVRRNRAAAPAAAPRHAAACRRAARSAARPSPWDRWCDRSVRWTMRALKIAAAAGLPQRIRVASALHSHTGMSLVA